MRGLWLLAVLIGFVVGGCGVGHLHPNTGKAFRAVFKAQRAAKFKGEQMSGEDAVISMHNLEKASKATDLNRNTGGGVLLPIQR